MGEVISVLPGISWVGSKAVGWNHPKADLFAYLTVDAGCWVRPHLRLSAG